MRAVTWRSVMMMSVVMVLGVLCSVAWSQSNETKVGIDKVPAPVKNAILETVGTGRLVDIGQFTENGKIVHYEIEMIVDGQEYDVLFAPDGKVLDKTHEGAAGAQKAQLEEVEFFIEYNASDKDAGVQVFLDGAGWDWIEIYNPAGAMIYRFNTDNAAKNIGITELFFESSEPSFDVLPFAELLKMYPEGEYEFVGQTVKGEKFESKTRFTHMVPAAPLVSPAAHSVVDPQQAVISWQPVTEPRGIKIASYQVIVEREDPLRVLDVKNLAPTATQLHIPADFLEYDTPYTFEVLAREESGNQTITVGFFRTAVKRE
ncbi:MAG: fibronectin type III domain-containing protein [Phycisphaeraceae bacterium]|nr:fibronectin type III domain-containing protein [Phycisphaeraceae bacterium]